MRVVIERVGNTYVSHVLPCACAQAEKYAIIVTSCVIGWPGCNSATQAVHTEFISELNGRVIGKAKPHKKTAIICRQEGKRAECEKVLETCMHIQMLHMWCVCVGLFLGGLQV